MQELTRLKSEEVSEAVPETLKNILLVMDAKGILTPQWKVDRLPQYVDPSLIHANLAGM